MRTASPWWSSLVFGIGLLFLLVGERLFGYTDNARILFSGAGVIAILLVTGARGWAMLGSKGARRRVERAFFLAHAATVVSLVLYLASTETKDGHLHTGLQILALIGILASSFPVLLLELSLGTARREAFDVGATDDGGVEIYRARELSWSGLSIGLAIALLMVTCHVATERNLTKNVSYFKTSSPGESTENIANASPDPYKVLLFFPPTNEVASEVRHYFEELNDDTHKFTIEDHDRLSEGDVAAKYKISKDGVIVIVRERPAKPEDKDKDKITAAADSQTIEVDTDIEKARRGQNAKLRTFDHEVNTALGKLARDKRRAYVIAGHGELTDPSSEPEDHRRFPPRATTFFKAFLQSLNYDPKDLNILDLSKDVPDDAAMIVLLAPTAPLQDAEWDSIMRYLDKGGRLLIAMDPASIGTFGPLEGKLGVKLAPGVVTDEVNFLPQRGIRQERRIVITGSFSSHPTTTGLSHSRAAKLILLESGALDDAPITAKGEAPKKTVTIRTPDTSFLDLDNDFAFTAATEKKKAYPIAEAFEGPKVNNKDGYRVLALASANLFMDIQAVVQGQRQEGIESGPLARDAIRWLGGEEVFGGDIVDETDKPIQHSKNEDTAWFTVTILGIPLIVTGLGFGFGRTRRRRPARTEVKK
ncbi:MAG TPA: Gldg family protein [Kofleriaceae bacterium]|jgi:hypothetical protein